MTDLQWIVSAVVTIVALICTVNLKCKMIDRENYKDYLNSLLEDESIEQESTAKAAIKEETN